MRESQQKLDEVVFFQQKTVVCLLCFFTDSTMGFITIFNHHLAIWGIGVVFFPITTSKSQTKNISSRIFLGGIQTWKPTSPCTPAAKPIREWEASEAKAFKLARMAYDKLQVLISTWRFPLSLGGVGYCFNL